MDSLRQKKISRLVQKDLGEIFQREIPDMTVGAMVSVTAVRVSSDLGIAKVYLSIFPTGKKDETFELIKTGGPKIRHLLGKRVGKQLRVIPDLQFYIDDTLDYIENIDRLLKD